MTMTMTTDAVAERAGEGRPPLGTAATIVGTTTAATPARGSDYAALCGQVRQAGLLRRRAGWYFTRIALNIGLFAAGWTVFVLLGDSWWQLVTAGYLAVVFTQLTFIGHDAGHRQILAGRRGNDTVGLLHGNLLTGLSYRWWVEKHQRHHSHPNQVDQDPDVGTGVFVFDPAAALGQRGIARWRASYQAYLFFPMLLLEGLNLHVASVRDLASRRDRRAAAEAALLAAHLAAYLTVVALVLSPVKAVVFVAVHQALFGLYLGCTFAPNHKGMPLATGDERDFLRRQVLTARNIRGGRVADLVSGGLNYQIEHHLFPSMPRPNLRHAQPLIREFCAARGISYQESGVLGSYRQALRHLHRVGAPLRHPTPEKRLVTATDLPLFTPRDGQRLVRGPGACE
jgi:fatty acid desaturase